MSFKHGLASDAADAVVLAKTTTLTFDDVDVSAFGGIDFMPAGYGGLTWSDAWAVENPGELHPDMKHNNGLFRGITSGEQIALNSGAAPVEITAKSFNIQSFELTAAWDKTMKVEITASSHGDQVFDQTFTVNDKGPMKIELNLKGIDDLVLTPTEVRVDPKAGGSGAYMVIDDMVVSKVKSLPSQAGHADGHTGGAAFAAAGHALDGHLPMTQVDLAHHVVAIA